MWFVLYVVFEFAEIFVFLIAAGMTASSDRLLSVVLLISTCGSMALFLLFLQSVKDCLVYWTYWVYHVGDDFHDAVSMLAISLVLALDTSQPKTDSLAATSILWLAARLIKAVLKRVVLECNKL